ncbi:uncharacterized protein LACBIDRAFT_312660 [Laccaria bicolor S238N-H82]|uniref:Predicted protein n=1 Tax=Laccaria bicolor (strain S238N-H82 / ATCC MYA-4686) TaxID=486041 RepID=B0DWK4_LACBS|nr:uncharacterized protein LACBIDRAFT_312660 [Laccaria bicolor S238N-H82]EDR01106.1 predicted protein [Laccaria bicolor S238N-H82]|eukprot:XP_001888325.1 predicted protein [Laccaria bicolor S238N-H82]
MYLHCPFSKFGQIRNVWLSEPLSIFLRQRAVEASLCFWKLNSICKKHRLENCFFNEPPRKMVTIIFAGNSSDQISAKNLIKMLTVHYLDFDEPHYRCGS